MPNRAKTIERSSPCKLSVFQRNRNKRNAANRRCARSRRTGHGRLANAALAGRNRNNVLHARNGAPRRQRCARHLFRVRSANAAKTKRFGVISNAVVATTAALTTHRVETPRKTANNHRVCVVRKLHTQGCESNFNVMSSSLVFLPRLHV